MPPTSLDPTAPVDADTVLVRDVGPRDGLQAISQEVPLALKIAMTRGLVAAGVPRVEAGSFVSPRAVPRMADSRDVFDALPHGSSREALVVNARGARAAMIGRPWVYAAAAGGERGVSQLLATLHGEMKVSMALTGAPRVEDINSGTIDQ